MLHINYDGFTSTKSLILTGGDYLNCGNAMATLLNGTNAFSITGRIKATSFDVSGGFLPIINKRLNTAGPGAVVYFVAAGAMHFFLEGTSVDRCHPRTVTGAYSTGSWFQFGLSYTGSQLASGVTFYKAGVVQAKDSDIQDDLVSSAANSRSLWIGNRENSAAYGNANFYSLQIWNKALSTAEHVEANAILNSAGMLAHSASANLVFNMRFGNDPMDSAVSGTGVIKDRVGGYDATPIGTVSGDIVTDAP